MLGYFTEVILLVYLSGGFKHLSAVYLNVYVTVKLNVFIDFESNLLVFCIIALK